MEEKRKDVRVPWRVSVQIDPVRTTQFHNLPPAQGSLSCDLSMGGIRVYFNDFLPLNTKLRIHLPVSALKNVQMDGQVVWVNKVPHAEQYQLGLKFDENDVNAESRITLKEIFGSN